MISSGPKHAGQTKLGPTASARPHARHRSPLTWGRSSVAAVGSGLGGSVVTGRIGVSRVMSMSSPSRRPDRPARETERPFPEEGPWERIPYLAGGPARIWHRAGIAAGRLSGFTGPVPPPLLIRVFSCRAILRGRAPAVNVAAR